MGFLRSVFSDDDGAGSFSRIASGVMTLGVIIWVSIIVYTTRTFPNVDGMVALMSVHYAVNQVQNVAASIKGNNNNVNIVDKQ